MPETSIIIRTKNEEKWIGECLKRLTDQTYKNFEILIIDDGSDDKTLEIVKNFNVRLFKIKPEEFSYPFALNYGCRQASADKYFAILSGHSLPISNTWLEDGISSFLDESIMGVYGCVWASPDGSFWEKIIWNKWRCKLNHLFKRRFIVKQNRMGVLGFTNAIIRKDLWEKHNFDENYGLGGEDGEWAGYWFLKGYKAVKDIKFSVYHSHGLNRKQLVEQWEYWKSLSKPQPFIFPKFRRKNKI